MIIPHLVFMMIVVKERERQRVRQPRQTYRDRKTDAERGTKSE